MKNYQPGSFIIIAVMSLTAEAESFYLGASAGAVTTDTGVTNVTGTASLDEDDTGFKIFAGKQVNNNVAIEFHYADLGEASLTGNTGDRFDLDGLPLQFITDNASIKGEIKNIGIAMLIGLDAMSSVNPYFKVGLQKWDSELTVTSASSSNSVSDDGTDPFFGVGLTFGLSQNVKLRAEFERNDIDDTDTDFISGGIQVGF